MRNITIMLGAVAAIACNEVVPNRTESPEAAFFAARAGLRNHALHVYFDALTDSAVRSDLANSVMICLVGANPTAVALGFKRSVGCESILKRHGWPLSDAKQPTEYKAAIEKIQDRRGLVQALEENHRRNGVGSSFDWRYLDSVKITKIVINGSRASGLAVWDDGEKLPVEFEKDETGWRFNPMPREP